MDETKRIQELKQKLTETESLLDATFEQLNYTEHLLQGNILKRILLGELPEPDRIESLLKQYNIHFNTNWFIVTLLRPDAEHYMQAQGLPPTYDSMRSLGVTVENICNKHLTCYIANIQMNMTLVIPIKTDPSGSDNSLEKIYNKTLRQVRKILQELSDTHDISCKTSVSFPVQGVNWLFWAYDSALTLLTEDPSSIEYINYFSGRQYPKNDATSTRFTFEQCFYSACLQHNYIQACQLLINSYYPEMEYIDASFSRSCWMLQHYMTFLLNTMGVDLHTPHNDPHSGRSLALIQCYVNLGKCSTRNDVLEALQNFSDLVAGFADQDILGNTSSAKANAAKAYIQAHFAEPDLTVEKICEKLQISRTALSKGFKTATGITVLEYIHQCRLGCAKQMIADGISLEKVATSCGYYSRRNFTEVFKRYENVTPSDYRSSLESLYNT